MSALPGAAYLHLANGLPDGSGRVTDGSVLLNEAEVVAPYDLGAQVAVVDVPVTLEATTPLSVTLTGSVGSTLTLTLERRDATLLSVTPNAAPQGATLTVAVVGSNTHFLQGTTQLWAGPGVSVGGAPPGAFGPVTVQDPTHLTATLAIPPTTFLGPRTLLTATPGEWAALVRGFTVLAGTPALAGTSVSTLAGTGTPGLTDGPGNTAQFAFPGDVAARPDGSAVVADTRNNAVRVVQADGTVSTVPLPATLRLPTGITQDGTSRTILADTGQCVIRIGNANGTFQTIGAPGECGFADGGPTVARFRFPRDVAVDGSGTLYVADTGNFRVRKIDPQGTVTTLAGAGTFGNADGPAATATFGLLAGIVVAPDGRVFVSDAVFHRLRQIAPDGTVAPLAGTGVPGFAEGAAPSAQFAFPTGLSGDASGTVYVADTLNQVIRRLTPAGQVETLAGTGAIGSQDGPGDQATFTLPTGLDAAPGALLVADTFSHKIRLIQVGPALTGLTPPSGVQGASLPLTVTGTNLTGATALTFLRNGAADPDLTATNLSVNAPGTELTATLTIAPTAALGDRVATVTTPAGTSEATPTPANTFTVLGRISLVPDFVSLVEGQTGTLTVQLSAPAPTGGLSVTLTSAAPGIASIPSSVTVPAGATSAPTTVTGLSEGTTNLTASAPGFASGQSTVTVRVPVPTITGFSPSASWAGTGITITGTGFVAVSSVSFNGMSAPEFTVIDPTTIGVIVPPGATTGPISVTTAGGTGISAGAFTVLPPPDFSLQLEPTTVTAPVGTTTGLTVKVVPTGGFTGLTQLSTGTLPAGLIATFVPSSVFPNGSASLVLTPSGAVPVGSVPIEVRGTASIGGTMITRAATATLTVTAPILAGIGVTPQTPTPVVGQTLQLQVVGTLSDGTTTDVTAAATWTSSLQAVATVSAAGLVSAVNPGTTTITATHPDGFTASTLISVLPPPAALRPLGPQSLTLTQGETGSLTVAISPAQPTETTISLTSSDPSVASVPATITIPAGQIAVAVPVTTGSPGTVTITASVNGGQVQSTITVAPAGPVVTSLTPATLNLAPGASGTLTVTLNAPQTTDTLIAFTSSDVAVVTVPSGGTVTILAGQLSQSFAVTSVGPGQATITATLNGATVQHQVLVTSRVPTVVSLLPPILALTEGASGTLTVTLDAAQPTDTEVLLSTTDAESIGLPGDSVIVPANTSSTTFTVAGNVSTFASVTASLNGTSVTAATVVWRSLPGVRTITCPTAVAVGAIDRCTLTLNFAQPTVTEVPLAVAAPNVLSVPAVVTVPANTGSATFDITGIAPGSADVTAGPLNGTIQQTTVQVVPPAPTLVSLVPSPATLAVGAVTTLTVTLNATQPTDTVIPVTSSAPGLVTLPSAVRVPAGSLTVPIPVTGLATGTTTLTVGPVNGTQAQSTITVTNLPPTVTAVTPAEPTVVEWMAVPLTVTLSAAQPEPTVVSLTSDDPDTIEVPATVTVSAGALSATFPVMAWASGTATVTVGPLNGSSVQTTVTVIPWELVSLSVVPATLTLATGRTWQFMAVGTYNDGTIEDDTEWAWWESSETDVAGISNINSGLATAHLGITGTTTITASLEGLTATALLTVTPSDLIQLILAPSAPTELVGGVIQFRASGIAFDTTIRDVTQDVTWTSSNLAVASITSPGGVATVLAPGTATITATHPEGFTASTTLTGLTVLPPTLTSVVPNRGPVGTHVSLLGTGLGGTTQVTFNGTTAAFTVQSGTELTATVPSAATSGPITVTTPNGSATSPGSFTITGPPTITITSPADGATLTDATTIVRGTVTSDVPEVGVSVNGLPAQVNGGQWVVEVPLQVGANLLTATALDGTGTQATASITVTGAAAGPAPLRLLAVPTSGIAPLTVTWQVVNQTGRTLVQFALDEQGTGTFNPPVTSLDGVQTTYLTPGIFHPVLRATDDQGTQYTATTSINVLDRTQVDAILQTKWSGMKAALQGNAIETALGFFLPSQRARYRTLFTLLSAQLPQIAQDMENIELVYLLERHAQYRIRRTELVGGQPTRVTYYIDFIQGADGVWRIRDF